MDNKQKIMDKTQSLSKTLRAMAKGDVLIVPCSVHSEGQVRVTACRLNKSTHRRYSVSIEKRINDIEVRRTL